TERPPHRPVDLPADPGCAASSPPGAAWCVLAPRREGRQRVLSLDELILLGADHLARPLELAVEQEAADLARAAEEGSEGLAREPLRYVVPTADEGVPGGADGRLAGPHEERPAPVPPTPQVFCRAAAARWTPEHQVLAGAGERLPGAREADRLGRR